MILTAHFQALNSMYLAAPITKIFPPEMKLEHGKASISILVKEDYFHIASGLHGSVYFKLLDDASAFAAYTIMDDCFAYTANFNINFTAPVSKGKITAVGELIRRDGKKLFTTSRLYTEEGLEIANAEGLFIKSSTRFMDLASYRDSYNDPGPQ